MNITIANYTQKISKRYNKKHNTLFKTKLHIAKVIHSQNETGDGRRKSSKLGLMAMYERIRTLI